MGGIPGPRCGWAGGVMSGGEESPRVYVKSLTLRGFKSFASATSLRFESGITCVVGPNGSGKSNIVDAFAWVMGEQDRKSTRLNSSHVEISYAVFCLKKKKKKNTEDSCYINLARGCQS